MTSLTFVRKSDCFYGKMSRTTGFWSGRRGFESQLLPTLFNLIITTENRDTAPFYSWKVSIPEFFWNQKGFSYEIFRYWDKKFRRKIVTLSNLPTSLFINFSVPETFWNTAQKDSSTKCFGTARQNNFDGKSWYPPLMHENFRYPKFSETPKDSPTNFSGTVRQKILNEKSWYPLFCIKYRISGGSDVCRKPLKTKFKTVVSFLIVCKSRSKYLYLGENYAGASRPSCLLVSIENSTEANHKRRDVIIILLLDLEQPFYLRPHFSIELFTEQILSTTLSLSIYLNFCVDSKFKNRQV